MAIVFWSASEFSIDMLLTYSDWRVLLLFARFLGPAQVITWCLLAKLWEVLQSIFEVLAEASDIRISMLLSVDRPNQAQLSAYKSLYLSTFLSLFTSSVLFMLGDSIPLLITEDTTLQLMLADLMPIFGLASIGWSIKTVCWSILSAQGRYRLATRVGYSGSWLVTVPLAALFSVLFTLSLDAQTGAVVIGYMMSGSLMAYFVFTSDWQQILPDNGTTTQRNNEQPCGKLQTLV